jgi:hypothetical protein
LYIAAGRLDEVSGLTARSAGVNPAAACQSAATGRAMPGLKADWCYRGMSIRTLFVRPLNRTGKPED